MAWTHEVVKAAILIVQLLLFESILGSYASLLIVERNTSVGNVPRSSVSQTAFSTFSEQLLESANLRKIRNGPLEGNVNRLKLIKRSMYGRAEVDLLKLRVLYHSKKSQDRKNKKKKKQGQPVVHLKCKSQDSVALPHFA